MERHKRIAFEIHYEGWSDYSEERYLSIEHGNAVLPKVGDVLFLDGIKETVEEKTHLSYEQYRGQYRVERVDRFYNIDPSTDGKIVEYNVPSVALTKIRDKP